MPDENPNNEKRLDYHWSARDAWKCLGMMLFFEIAFILASLELEKKSAAFNAWRGTGFGYFFNSLLIQSGFVVIAAYFARTKTLPSFLKAFGLDAKPGKYAAFGIVSAVIIRTVGHLVLVYNGTHGVSMDAVYIFSQTHGLRKIFFLVPLVLIGPFFEEAANRGFVFKAFRGSYSLWTSIALLVVWTAVLHRSQYTSSLVAVFEISLITIVQCYVREKSVSLWDCILCHLAFNVSLLFVPVIL
ncbi:MAG TPA: type II CAAX endopeptidase family protein [Verrucomicrobiae bacterium]